MIVKTTGPFMLLDTFGRQVVDPETPTEVKLTPLIKVALEDGRLVEVKAEKPKEQAKPEAAPAPSGPTSGRAKRK